MSTLLRKVERVRLIPGTPGSPGFPASSYCTPAPPTGLAYVECALPGVTRNPTESRAGSQLFNRFWLPGCVYREFVASGGLECSGPLGGIPPTDVNRASIPRTAHNCQPSAPVSLFWRVLDEFGRRERVLPPPNPPPPRTTFVPFSPPPASIEGPAVLPPNTRSLGGGCYAFDGIPEVPATPPRVVSEIGDAWDSGAHSIVEHPRDCRLRFAVTDAIGAACGLTPANTQPGVDVERITHGFIVSRNNGVPSVRVAERGVLRTGYIAAAVGTQLEVTRRGTQVVYAVAGVQVHASSVPSSGPVKAAASLYSPQDTIG